MIVDNKFDEDWEPPPYAGDGERPRLRCGDIVVTVNPEMVEHHRRFDRKPPHGVVVGANLEGSMNEALFGYHEFTVVVRESAGVSNVTDQRSHQFRIVPLHERSRLDRVRAVIYGWRRPTELEIDTYAFDRYQKLIDHIHDSIMDAVGSPESLRSAIEAALRKEVWRFAPEDESWEWEMLSALCPAGWWDDDFMDWPDLNELAIMAAKSYDEIEAVATARYEQRIAELELELSNIRETLKARDRIEAPWP